MPKTMFRKQLLASSVAMVVASGVSAQTNQAIQEEELVVTGIRASLTRSMDMKRDAQGVVDAINAEDIGKFPDTNLAESLQRITGVSIDRVNGEGARITVRGLGPDFNLVTLNGRQMPGASIGDTFVAGNRSFDFGNIASEGVSAVEVFKTVRAANPVGGIGATVNIKTRRPLEKPGVNASFGVKGVHDQSGDAVLTPELTGFYSNTFADDTFGVGISASYQNRQAGAASAVNGNGWFAHTGDSGVDLSDESNNINAPGPSDIYGTPQQLAYTFSDFERTRINGQLVLQWAPVESVTMTLDYTYSQNEIDSEYHDVGIWFGQSNETIYWSQNANGIQTPLIYEEDTTGPDRDLMAGYDPTNTQERGGDLTFGTGVNNVLAENNSFGFNVEWQATDTLTLSFDAHHSEAELGPDDDSLGNSVGISVSSYSREKSGAIWNGSFPIMTVDLVNTKGGTDLLAEDFLVSGSFFRRSQMISEIDQVQFDGDWEFTENMSINFGAAVTDVSNESAFDGVQRDTWGGLGEAGWITDDMFTVETIRDKFVSAPNDQRMYNEIAVFDFNKLRQFAIQNLSNFNVSPDLPPINSSCGHYYCGPEVLNNQFLTEESSVSAYLQFNWETEIGSMPFNLSMGIRHEETEITSPAQVQAYEGVTWPSVNEMNLGLIGTPVKTDQDGEYSYSLPSIDADLEIVEGVKLRASYGQSIARPNYGDIQGGQTVNSLVRPGGTGGTAGLGDPGLKPYLADNFDVSVEWYYGETNYLSVGYFRKEVDNYLGSAVFQGQDVLDGVPDPSRGARAQAAIDADPNDAIDGFEDYALIRDWIIANTPDDGIGRDGENIYGIEGEDPDVLFDVTRPVNNKKAEIDGIEFNIQHVFGESGFGTIYNITLADSDTEFLDKEIGVNQFVVPGLSKTYNIVGFYEKDGLQVRVSYNWRDNFLGSPAQGTGPNPNYTEEYSQIDLNASYDFSDQLSVFVEGINITNETQRTFGRDYYQTLGVFEYGARYNIGARYTF